MAEYSLEEDELFPIEGPADLLKKLPDLVEDPPKRKFHNLLDLLDFWDFLSKAPSSTTLQVKAALRRDMEELGISD